MRIIDSIIIHCTDTQDDKPLAGRLDGDFNEVEIERWHKERALKEPWSHYLDKDGTPRYIGYHYVIRRTGEAVACRPEVYSGCHTKGMNKNSIGVCWVGRDLLAAKQKARLVQCVAELCVKHGLSGMDVYGHNQFSKKTCPNFSSAFTFESIDHFRQVVNFAIRDLK